MAKTSLKLLLVLLLAGLALFFYYQSPSRPLTGKFSANQLGDLRRQVTALIKARGAKAAYEQTVVDFSQESFIVQHDAVHLFGEVLYDFAGFAGINVCDRSYAWGCFHGIFVRAIDEHGSEAVTAFYQSCRQESPGDNIGCQHGIGHALGEFYGPDNLATQLETCYQLEWHGPVGCAGGVFMEYNLPGWFGVRLSSIQPRSFDQSQPYFPCNELEAKFQEACFYRLGEWFLEVFAYDLAKISPLCDQLTNHSWQKNCWYGVGSPLGENLNWQADLIINTCLQAVSETGKKSCLVGAAGSLIRSNAHELAKQVCGQNSDCLNEAVAFNRTIE